MPPPPFVPATDPVATPPAPAAQTPASAFGRWLDDGRNVSPADDGGPAGRHPAVELWDSWLAALQARCIEVPSDAPVVVLASYHGAHQLPNLTPLLALALAQHGARVLVHGLATGRAGASSEAIFRDLGLPACADAAAVHARWGRHQPAYLSAERLCPGWPRLFALPPRAPARGIAHRLAPWLNPVRGARVLRVVDTGTSPWAPASTALARHGGADALLLRGCGGEPVADARRRPRLQVWLAGQPEATLALPAHEGPLTDLPLLPPQLDASPTALYIQAVLGGEKPMPEPLAEQLALMQLALRAMAGDAAPAPY